MALPNYDDVSRDLEDRLEEGFKRRDEDQKFATRKLAENVLSDNELRCIYKSLSSSEERHSSPPTLDNPKNEDQFVQNIKDKNLYDFLAVLLYARCSQPAAQAFKTNLVFANGPKISLPVKRDDLLEIFGERRSDIVRFLKSQKYFCTIIIGFPEEDTNLQKGRPWRLPWLRERPIRGGSYGEVHEVEIAEHHFTENKELSGAYHRAHVIARKDFVVDKKASFDTEVKVMKEIRQSASKSDNVLKSFGTLTIEGDNTQFMLFMPKADMDLQQYLTQDNADASPLTADKRYRMISSAKGLADGLDFLHTQITGEGCRPRVCYHMDLKPSNVLIFLDGERQIWKISDFGMSKVKDKRSGHTTQEDILTDFRKLFIRRSQVETGVASKTVIARDPGTFLPSEAYGNGKTMNEKSDVWALGCIISLVFTYMEFRTAGLERYTDLRAKYSNLPWDTFYGKSTMTRSFPINKGVEKQHQILVDAAGKRGSIEKGAVQFMLGFLKSSVFLEKQDSRCEASEVSKKLRETYQFYAETQGTEERQKNEEAMTVSRDIVTWRLNGFETTRPKGCECSPNGDLIAYWDEDRIMIFTKSRGEKQELTTIDNEGRKPDDANRVWKAIKLTNRHLIALTTGSRDNCYIFDILLALDMTVYTVFSLPNSETSLLEFAPDLISFITVRKNTDGRNRLYSATIKPFIGLLSSAPQETPAHGQKKVEAGISLVNEKKAWFKSPAEDILHIISHSKNRGYVAFQRQESPLVLLVAFFCLDEGNHTRAELDERNFDGETASLFTDMACIDNTSTGSEILVVLQTKRISEIRFTDLNEKPAISDKSSIEDYRILKITMDKSPGKILALGVQSRNDSVCLLEIKRRSNATTLQVVKCLAVLDKLSKDDELKLRICQGGERIALVTGLRSNGRSSVYQVRLSELSST